MLSPEYLELGLAGLGRCVHAPWDAHFPAAVLAGYYYAAGAELDPETEGGLESQLKRLIASKPELFIRYEGRAAPGHAAAPIVDALEASIDKFSELGHNSIFAAYALRALRDLGDRAPGQVVLDLTSVIRAFNCSPARYWLRLGQGHDPRKFALTRRTIFTDGISDATVAHRILEELPKFRNVYTQMGSKSHIGHLLTQSHSLLTLRGLGFRDLANRGFYSLECRFVLLKDSQPHTSSPRSFYRPATRSPLLPTEAEFWAQDFTRCQWDEGHAFKYTFSFYELRKLCSPGPITDAATEKFRYLITPNERSTSI